MNELKIEPYYNQPNENSFLYRYLTIDKLLDLLLSERISLVRLNLFDDKLEGSSLKHLRLNHFSELAKKDMQKQGGTFASISLTVNPTERNKRSRHRELFQDTNYASCWYIDNYESVAMWQLYSKPDSVAIKIPYKVLNKELLEGNFEINGKYEKLKFGAISYHRFKNIANVEKNNIETDIQGFIKDSSFDHEREFRIMVENKDSEKKYLENRGVLLDEDVDKLNNFNEIKVKYLKFNNFKKLPFEIIYHPECQEWHKKNIEKIISQFNIKFEIHDSELKNTFK
ncbi:MULTISPECIES: DUF2971 domain-containing protein [unclassified Polaribacter]|uniref:DUF2971 domain-containing protein n=1 Tax=unclassified Polaribacter TaxID=196858 RepID=UPI00140DCAE8|nr:MULTISPECIES: hypothetical protein [unclassified Polaribacter]